MGEGFAQLCGDTAVEDALRQHDISSIEGLAALDEGGITMLAQWSGVAVESLRSAKRRAEQHQADRRCTSGQDDDPAPRPAAAQKRRRTAPQADGGASSSSSSSEEVANEASDESDYEPAAPSPPPRRKRQRAQHQPPRARERPAPVKKGRRESAPHRAGSGQTRPRHCKGLAGVVGGRLAGFFGDQGVGTVDELVHYLSGLDPADIPNLAAAAEMAEDEIHEAIGNAQGVALDTSTDFGSASESDENASPDCAAAEACSALEPQADRRRSSRESRKPRDWSKPTLSHGSTRAPVALDPEDLPPCPYAARPNVCWHCDRCGVLETLTNKKALAPFHTKHGWTWCNKSTGVEEDGDCFYHCIRLAMGTFHHGLAAGSGRADDGSSRQEVTVKDLRGWVADAASQQTLEHYQAMAAAGIDIEQSEGSLDSDLQAALAASSALAATGTNGVDLTNAESPSGVGAAATTDPRDDPDLAAAIAASIVTSTGSEVGRGDDSDSGNDHYQKVVGAEGGRHVDRNDLGRQEEQEQEQEQREQRQDDRKLHADSRRVSHRASRRQAEKRRNASLQDVIGPKLAAVFAQQGMFKADDIANIDTNLLPNLAEAFNVPEPTLLDAVEKVQCSLQLVIHRQEQEQERQEEEEEEKAAEDVQHQEQCERNTSEMTVSDDTGMPASPRSSLSATPTPLTATTPTQANCDARSKHLMSLSTGRRNRRPPSRWTDDAMAYENLGGSARKHHEIRAKQQKQKQKQKQRQQRDEEVPWLDAFRNSTVTDLPSLRDYIRREGAVYKGEGCMWADEIAFQVIADRLQLGILFIDINRQKDEWPYRVLAMPSKGIEVVRYVVLRLLSAAHYVPLARVLAESEYQPKQCDTESASTIATVPAAVAAKLPAETTESAAGPGSAAGSGGDGDGDDGGGGVGGGAAAAAAAAAAAPPPPDTAPAAPDTAAGTVDTPSLAGYAELREKGIECCCFEPTELPPVVKALWGINDSGRLLPVHPIGGCSPRSNVDSETTELEAALAESRLMASVQAQELHRNAGETAFVGSSLADSSAIVLD